MKLCWLSPALLVLDRVYEYISQDNPKAARDVFKRIRRSTKNLKRFPELGRYGNVPGTRELLVTGLPYLLVYRINNDTIEILRVLHTSQDLANPFERFQKLVAQHVSADVDLVEELLRERRAEADDD